MTKAACHIILHFSSLCLTWRSIKSLKKSPHSMDIEILQLWSLLAFHTVAVQLGVERVLSYIPFYYYFKMLILSITFLPGTKFPNFWFEVVLVPGMEKVHRACDVDFAGFIKYHVKMLPLRFLDLFLIPGIVASHEEGGGCQYDRVRKLREKQLQESYSSCSEMALTASSTDSSFFGSDLADETTDVDNEGEEDNREQTQNSQQKPTDFLKEGSKSNGIEMEADDMRVKLDLWRKEKKRNSPAKPKGSPVDRQVSPHTPTSARRRANKNASSSSRSSSRRKTFSASRASDELRDQLSPSKGKMTPARSNPSRRIPSGRKSAPSDMSSKPILTPLARRSSSISSPVARSRLTASSMELRQFSRVHHGHYVSPRSTPSSPPFRVPPASAFKDKQRVTASSRQGEGTPERQPLKPLFHRTRPNSADNATPSRRIRRSTPVENRKDSYASVSSRYSVQKPRQLNKLKSESSEKAKRRRPESGVENMSPQSTTERKEEALLDEKMSVRERLDLLMDQEEMYLSDEPAGEAEKTTIHTEQRLSLGERIRSLVTGNVDIRLRDYLFDLDLPFSPSPHCASARATDLTFVSEEDEQRREKSEEEKSGKGKESKTPTKSNTLRNIAEERESERSRRDAAFEKHRQRIQSATPDRTGTVLHRYDLTRRRTGRTEVNDMERHSTQPTRANARRSRNRRSNGKGNILEKEIRSVSGKSKYENNESGKKNVTLRRSKRIAESKPERS